MEITVYEDNRKDSPRAVTVEEVVERAEERYSGAVPARAVNAALAEFGSFDPQSAEYKRFESEAVSRLIH